MRIQFEITQLDTHAHLTVSTSERNDLKLGLGESGNLTMTSEEWKELSNALICRFGAMHIPKSPLQNEIYRFVIVR